MAPKKVKLGNNERMSFSKIDEVIEMAHTTFGKQE